MHSSDGEVLSKTKGVAHKDFLTYDMFLHWGGAEHRGLGDRECDFWTSGSQKRHHQMWGDENGHEFLIIFILFVFFKRNLWGYKEYSRIRVIDTLQLHLCFLDKS